MNINSQADVIFARHAIFQREETGDETLRTSTWEANMNSNQIK